MKRDKWNTSEQKETTIDNYLCGIQCFCYIYTSTYFHSYDLRIVVFFFFNKYFIFHSSVDIEKYNNLFEIQCSQIS